VSRGLVSSPAFSIRVAVFTMVGVVLCRRAATSPGVRPSVPPRATTNKEVIHAIKTVIPDAAIDLPPGRDPRGPDGDSYLDITRILEDTGYAPAYDIQRGVADYIGWLKAGHER
jgi:nucleoside-diphosphate-sugar epimerase